MPLAPGTQLGPYEVVSPIGAGGMGEVYRARHAKLERDVAVKVLPATVAGDRESLARFEREAKAVAALSHPNILSIFDFGTHDGVATPSWSFSTARHCAADSRPARCRRNRPWTSRCRSRAACRPRTRRGSCIATSSPRTCF